MKYTICLVAILCGHTVCAYSQEKVEQNRSNIFHYKKGSGNPAVIFVSGLGEDHNTWQIIQNSIARYTLTVSYDRAGLGSSADDGAKKDLGSLAKELHELIKTLAFAEQF